MVFARFRPEIAAIENLLRKKGIKYGSIYGDVPQAERGAIVDDFQQNPETKVFVAQIQTAGLGITLHAASAAVFYSELRAGFGADSPHRAKQPGDLHSPPGGGQHRRQGACSP